MTRQRTFSVLLAVALALLGLDLVLRLSPQEAAAQEPEFRIFPELPVLEPKVVSISSEQIWSGSAVGGIPTIRWRITRAWSDGQVDVSVVRFGDSSNCNVGGFCGPVVIIPAN